MIAILCLVICSNTSVVKNGTNKPAVDSEKDNTILHTIYVIEAVFFSRRHIMDARRQSRAMSMGSVA